MLVADMGKAKYLMKNCINQFHYKYQFYFVFPVMCATTGYDLLKHHEEILVGGNFINLAVGFVISFIVAFLAIKLFLKFLESFTFVAFGIYRILFGILLLIIF